MQAEAADAKAAGAREDPLGHHLAHLAVEVADAAKAAAVVRRELDPELGQARHRIGHQPLAAGLVDRRPRALDHPRRQAGEPRPDGGGEAGRTTADHQQVGRRRGHVSRSGPPRQAGPPSRRRSRRQRA